MHIILIAAGLIFALFCCAMWVVGGTLVVPSPVDVGDLPADLPGDTIRLESDSGVTVVGWHIRSKERRGVIVLAHPYRGSRLAMLNRARLLYTAGYSIVMFDLRAHGETGGDRTTIGHLERLDVQTSVKYARQHHPQEPLGIVGFSMGGAATLLAQIPNVDAMVLEAVYPSIRAAICNRVKSKVGVFAWLPGELLMLQLRPRMGVTEYDMRPIDQIAKVDCPILMISGTADPSTTAKNTADMFAAAIEPKQLWMIEGALHEDLYDFVPNEYEPRVLEFFREHLATKHATLRSSEQSV